MGRRNADSLVRGWRRACLSNGPSEEGAVRTLLEFGVGDGPEQLRDVCAEAVAVLGAAGALSWGVLGAALAPVMGCLAELLLDTPHAHDFLEQLFARVLLCYDAREFDPAVLAALPRQLIKPEGGSTLVWTLLLGTLRRMNAWCGPEFAQRAISRRELSAALRQAGACSRRWLAKFLQSEGIVCPGEPKSMKAR